MMKMMKYIKFFSIVFGLFGSVSALPEVKDDRIVVLIPYTNSSIPPFMPNATQNRLWAQSLKLMDYKTFDGSFTILEMTNSNDEATLKKFFGQDIVIDKNNKFVANGGGDNIKYSHKLPNKKGPSKTVTNNDPDWALRRISSSEHPDQQYKAPSHEGVNVNVYVLDSGIKINHVDFNGRAKNGAAFAEVDSFDDVCNHGTKVAGLVASSAWGVARRSNIINVRVLGNECFGTALTVAKGIGYVIEQKKANPSTNAIILIAASGDRNKVVDKAVETAKSLGIPVIVSAGNENVNVMEKSPAGSIHAFTVASMNFDWKKREDSNYGSGVDLFAPGENVASPFNVQGQFQRISGTSAAAALTAGVVALVYAEKPEWNHDQVLGYIKSVSLRNVVRTDIADTNKDILQSGVHPCDGDKYCLSKI